MNFATFHVELEPTQGVHPNATMAASEYLEMIGLMSRSVRLIHPEAVVSVITDERSSFATLRGQIDVHRYPIDRAALMLERTAAQLRFIEEYAFDAPLVLLDSDILLNASLASVFERDFDVALTWRESADMPINGGLILLNNRRREAVLGFFRAFLARYRSEFARDGSWFGDQRALHALLGLESTAIAQLEQITVGDCRVLLLPCEQHNYSPANRAQAVRRRLVGRTVLHFKGERKRLMRLYWQAHLLPLELNTFGNRLTSWGARAQLALMSCREPRP